MPVCWRKKMFIRYAYNVPFIQQLGWFGNLQRITEQNISKPIFIFLKYGDYAFNYANTEYIRNASLQNNFILPLHDYNKIAAQYKNDFIHNLKKAQKENFTYTDEKISVAIDLYQALYSNRFPHVGQKDFDNFKRLCVYPGKKFNVVVKKVSSSANEILCIALLLQEEQRIYNLMKSSTGVGRKNAANHFLLDSIFKEFDGTDFIFDFEGSDIEGIKNFYKKFGAVNQPYARLRFNKLLF
jgi:hypothetical protein